MFINVIYEVSIKAKSSKFINDYEVIFKCVIHILNTLPRKINNYRQYIHDLLTVFIMHRSIENNISIHHSGWILTLTS